MFSQSSKNINEKLKLRGFDSQDFQISHQSNSFESLETTQKTKMKIGNARQLQAF